MRQKVVLGLSDGVDSAVAAHLLLEQGYDVYGVYLDIGGAEARHDAQTSANLLGIELRVVDIAQELEKRICVPFCNAYLAGKTPSPCVHCNPDVKFRVLSDIAREIGAEYIATGHYCVCENGRIHTGYKDNDQSYMLSRLRPDQVKQLLLPLGAYKKTEVREIAKQMGLTIANKPDSRENCFIKGMPYYKWIEQRCHVQGKGPVYFRGEVIAEHEGIHRYTVGQRWPEMLGERRGYIGKIDAQENSITLVLWEELFTNEISLTDVTWISETPPDTFRGIVRARHTRWEMPECTVAKTSEGVRIITDTDLRAPTPGQAAAIYQGDILLGGGTIL